MKFISLFNQKQQKTVFFAIKHKKTLSFEGFL